MKFFLIRHKKTGTYMPQMKRGKGYTHWNPSKPNKLSCESNTPRLIENREKCNRVINLWAGMPNAEVRYDYDGDDKMTFNDDGRKKEDLEIVPIELVVRTL